MKIQAFKKAFTLAEVLITLGIIGVVAAMTIPTLINAQQEKATITKLKKTYSVLQQALLSAQQEYGDVPSWGFVGNYQTDAQLIANNISHT